MMKRSKRNVDWTSHEESSSEIHLFPELFSISQGKPRKRYVCPCMCVCVRACVCVCV